MNDNELQVKFGGDVKDFEAGAEAVKTALGGMRGSVQTLVDAFMVLGGAASGSFREMRSGALEAHEQIKGATESLVEMREMIVGIGESLIAAFAVEQLFEFAKKMGEAGEQIEHTGIALGMTIDEVQGLQSEANATGMSLEGVTGAAQRLERALAMAHATSSSTLNRQAAAFKQLGININEARTPAELFNEVVAKFAEMPPSLDKSQEAMALFGRNIAEVAPLLGLTKEQLAEVDRQTQEYNLKNADAVTQAAALGERFNENKNAMQGVSDVLAQAFAPTLAVVVQGMNDLAAAFIHSYNEGGAAKYVLEGIDVVFKGVIATVHTLAVGFLELWHTAVGAIEAIIAPVYALGGALDAVLRGKGISGGVAAFKQQMADMDSSAVGHFRAAQQAGEDYLSFEQRLWSSRRAQSHDTPAIRTRGDGVGGGAQKKPQDTWLQDQKTAFLDAENAHKDTLNNELADEIDFWQKLVDTGQVPAKHLAEVQRTIAQERYQLNKQELQQEVQDERQALQDKTATINAELRTKVEAIQEEIRAVQQAAQSHQISWQQAHDKIVSLIRDEAEAQKQAALEIYTARIAADEQIKSHYAENTNEFRNMVRDEQKAWDDLQKARVSADMAANRQIQQNEEQTLKQIEAQWHQHIDGIVSSFGSGIKGMIEGTQTFQQAMLNVADAILQTFINIGERLVENWIVNMLTNKVASATTAVGQIADNAAVAGSAAFASTAAIPIIGPELAPEAAAAAYAGALSFMGAVAFSAEGGWGQVPYDGAPTLLHKNEMVLPARIASPLRQMVEGVGGVGPSARSADQGVAGGGDTHHHWNVSAMDAQSFVRVMDSNPRLLRRVVERQVRNLAA